MDGYTKLHAKLVMSSIWNADNHVRILWITMLAIADAGGNVEGSVGGLAALARITPDQCREALEILCSPDPDSSDETTGERLRKEGPGVWHVINHAHYRERQTRRQAMQAAATRKRRSKDGDVSPMSPPTQTQDTGHTTQDGDPDWNDGMNDRVPPSPQQNGVPAPPSTRTGESTAGAEAAAVLDGMRRPEMAPGSTNSRHGTTDSHKRRSPSTRRPAASRGGAA